ncbi:MAG: hypothetical protein IT480_18350 [Gammaproteobacteria bacterium]|nr:hypothetical protein [Gammaproteobacteria bacterium]
MLGAVLAEVTVRLAQLPAMLTISNAAIRVVDGRRGAWKWDGSKPVFAPLKLGRSDLDGNVQVLDGLRAGDQVILYSEAAINARSRLRIVDALPGIPR